MLLAAILDGWIVGDSVYRKVADAVPNPKWSRRHGRIPAAAQLEPVPIGTRRFETRYVQIKCNTGTHSQTFFPSAIRLWNTLPVEICQLYLRTVLRPISAVSVSFEHRTTSCFYRLHCIVFYPKLLFTAARLSRYICLWCDTVLWFGTVIGRHRQTDGP